MISLLMEPQQIETDIMKYNGDSLSIINSNAKHPLTSSSKISDGIIKYLPISDVLNCRLVCQLWNKSSIPILRQSKIIKFRMKLECLQEFTQLMRSSQDFPYSRYELEFYYINDKIVKEFLSLLGIYITSLQLNNCRCTTTELYHLLQVDLPNLENFSVNCDPIENTGRLIHLAEAYQQQQQMQQNDEIIICNSNSNNNVPKLKSLSLVGEFCTNDGLLIDLMKFSSSLDSLHFKSYDIMDDFSAFEQRCFSLFLKPENTPSTAQTNLENLQFGFRLREIHVDKLLGKNLQNLKSLHINLDESVQPETLIKLLNSYCNTLKRLDVDFKLPCDETQVFSSTPIPHQSSGQAINIDMNAKLQNEQACLSSSPSSPVIKQKCYKLPQMFSLSRLSLTNFKGSLTFLNHCKVLKYLTLVNCDISEGSLSGVVVHPGLHSFVSSTKLNQAIITQIAQLFPNLKELNTELDDDGLRVVFDKMAGLEELAIIGNHITDEGITGIENIFELMTIYDSVHELDDIHPNLLLVEQIPQIRIHPSINNLQSLRKIKIQDASALTDAAVRYGIVLCKKLVEISFLNSHVTDGSLEVIADNLTHLMKLELLSDINKFTCSGRNYLKNKIRGCNLILGQRDLLNLYRPRQFGSIDAGANKLRIVD